MNNVEKLTNIGLVLNLMASVLLCIMALHDRFGIFLMFICLIISIFTAYRSLNGWRKCITGWEKTLIAFEKYIDKTESKKKGKKK